MPSAPSRTSSSAAARNAPSSPSAFSHTTRRGEAPGTILYSTGNGQVSALPISPGMRGNRVSSIRMPTLAPYSVLPPQAIRCLSVIAHQHHRQIVMIKTLPASGHDVDVFVGGVDGSISRAVVALDDLFQSPGVFGGLCAIERRKGPVCRAIPPAVEVQPLQEGVKAGSPDVIEEI